MLATPTETLLRAFVQALQRRIMVYAVGLAPVEMGDEGNAHCCQEGNWVRLPYPRRAKFMNSGTVPV